MGPITSIVKAFSKMAAKNEIDAINNGKLNLKKVFNDKMNAKSVIKELIKNPECKSLEYADFREFPDFDNKCLELLTENCPNLKHLLFNDG